MSAPFKTHDLLGHPSLVHGFFGRQGGVSKGAYDSLNAGQNSDDNPDHVTENRKRIAAAINIAPQRLQSLNQIHSTKVITLTEPLADRPQADGLVTKMKGLALSALGADCGPVLLADTQAGVIGSCHAGWRGAVAGVTTRTIEAMEALGAERANIRAVLGPCISQENYEVGHDFRDSVVAERERYDAFFRLGPNDKPHFDLKAFIIDRLTQAGITQAEALPDCTYADATTYFSYRRNTHQGIAGYGRNLSTIMLR